MKKITIYDIARECGCTSATVSKVLNGKGNVSKAKREEIFEAVKKFGYVPSNAAKNLATNHSQLIGVVLHDTNERNITHELFSRILNSFRLEMENNGYDIVFLSRRSNEASYLQKTVARGLEGVFFLCADYSDKGILELMHSSIPNVSLDCEENEQSVTTDGKEAISKIVDELVKLGHRRIAYIDTKESEVAHKRLEGFKEGLRRNNIEFDPHFVLEGKYFATGVAEDEINRVLDSGINPTVIIMPDDYSAIDAYRALRKRNLTVGKDISIVGFDGIDLSNYVHPSLTTVSQNTDEMGRQAALLLMNNIRTGKKENKHISIDGQVIMRSSVKNLNN